MTTNDIKADSLKIDRGPLKLYEVTWKSGQVEQIYAHQLLVPSMGYDWFYLHAEISEKWEIVLIADAQTITSVRLIDEDSSPST